MPKLSEVFGVNARVPTYTYVDRSSLDGKVNYLLTADRHVVLFGAKQGKTSLRRKVLPEANKVHDAHIVATLGCASAGNS